MPLRPRQGPSPWGPLVLQSRRAVKGPGLSQILFPVHMNSGKLPRISEPQFPWVKMGLMGPVIQGDREAKSLAQSRCSVGGRHCWQQQHGLKVQQMRFFASGCVTSGRPESL